MLIKGLYFKSKDNSSSLTFFHINFPFRVCFFHLHIIHLHRSEASEQEYEYGCSLRRRFCCFTARLLNQAVYSPFIAAIWDKRVLMTHRMLGIQFRERKFKFVPYLRLCVFERAHFCSLV